MMIQDERYRLATSGGKVALKDQEDNVVLVITDTDHNYEKKRARAIYMMDCTQVTRSARNLVGHRREKYKTKDAVAEHDRTHPCETPITVNTKSGHDVVFNCFDQDRAAQQNVMVSFNEYCPRCARSQSLRLLAKEASRRYDNSMKRLHDICDSTSIIHTGKPNEEHIDNDLVATNDQGTEG